MFFHRLKNVTFPIVLFACTFLFSCTSRKKLVYFQGEDSKNPSEISTNYSLMLCKDDLLSITVSGIDVEAVKPFNSPAQGASGNGSNAGSPQAGYLIDSNGEIDFPVVGKIKLAGLTRMAASDLIAEKLKDYVNNPIVNIRITNFRITVLGEVRNPGTFTVANDRITLLQAIGISGDLLITGVRKNVLVIRETDGKKTETRVDLTSKDLFASPVYYLQQNDLVYVEPNRARINSSVINTPNVSLIVSAASILVTMAVLITSLKP